MAKQLKAIPQKLRITLILLIILLSFTNVAKAYEGDGKNVRVNVDGESRFYKTAALTVGDLFDSEEIVIEDLDTVNYDMDTPIEASMIIEVKRAMEVRVIIDGEKEQAFKTDQETIGKVLAQLKETTGLNMLLCDGQSSSQKISDGMTINVTVAPIMSEETEVTYETVPFQEITQENPHLPYGTSNVITEGANGERKITTKITFADGLESDREVIEDIITQEPVDRVVEIGTGNVIETENGTYLTVEKRSMKATAYDGTTWSGPTASGALARVGIVAVDPNVIPLGTELYIEGYGYAIAGDTGGLIKGDRIDLFYDTYDECVNFGVRYLDVYVLGEKIA
ncbi:MAG: G5 domain-containing protein [Firmicutes bacterium]|nr:G5 domain-containing protein [Bacillota bacterium]